ncbi:ATP-binding protein [Kineosporia sp. R_H_3]|uniref:ATP-binding protein n=1 Tax=Kineosporia sp. R_H_3 TaxID=1961848 RepID=UPI000B4BD620|nr:ATP-binding protein [Kineosporia sp. R_H_3]
MLRATAAPVAGGLVAAGASVVVAALATPIQFTALQVTCQDDICDTLARPTDELLGQIARAGMTPVGWAVMVMVVQWALLLFFCALGVVMMRRRPSLLSAVCGLGLMLVALQDFLQPLEPSGSLRWVLVLLAALNQASLFCILALFPDGRWHPVVLRRWAAPGIVAVSAGATLRTAGVSVPVLEVLETVVIVALVAAQVHRFFFRSDWVARQQARWVLVGFCVLAGLFVVAQVLWAVDLLATFQLPLVFGLYAAFLVLGVGFTFAVLRHRLYDVGLLLWRVVVYGGAAMAVLLCYGAIVALAGMSVTNQNVSALGAAVFAVVVLVGAWVADRLHRRVRTRLYGTGNLAAELVSRITGPGPVRTDLASTIAQALALPHVEVRDTDGSVISSFGGPGRTAPVRRQVTDGAGTPVGALLLSPAYGDELDGRDRRALAEVVPFVAMVLRAQRETEELRRARAAAAAAREDERRRLRRDLHDGLGPLLASQLVTLDSIRVAQQRGASVSALHEALDEQAKASIDEIRAITRALRPPSLDAGGLGPAITAEVDRAAAAGLDTSCVVSITKGSMPAALEVNVLRIVQESLTNVIRHAEATRVSVEVTVDDEEARLVVCDDGRGVGDHSPGVGLQSMSERAEELGGAFEVTAGQDGRGTRVGARIPL